jgi:hypothetical protein
MATGDIHGDFDQWSMVVLYDPKSGAIVHSHQVVTSRGGVHPDAPTLERQALEHAAHVRKAPVQGVAVLHVNPQEFDFHATYTVDVNTKRLKASAKARKAS